MKMFILLAVCGFAFGKKYRIEKFDGIPPEGVKVVGDMLIYPRPSNVETASAIDDEAYRWIRGIVPYEFDDSFIGFNAARAEVAKAMAAYATKTNGCITFRSKMSTDTHWILFQYGDNTTVNDFSCYSPVGRLPELFYQPQKINFPQWCLDQYGSIEHELAHSLGMYHEHQRPDRDVYVTINYEFVQDGEQNTDFFIQELSLNGATEYDYLSVMHYDKTAYSTDGESVTITTHDPEYQDRIGQREGLSNTDIEEINMLYDCPTDFLKQRSAQTENQNVSPFFSTLQKAISDFMTFLSSFF